MKREYLNLHSIEGPLIVLSGISNASYGEIVNIVDAKGNPRKGKVIKLDGDKVVAQVFEGTMGLSTIDTTVSFTGRPFEIGLSKYILGRTFSGIGEPIDGGGKVFAKATYNISGRVMNPIARRYPRNFVQTGISSIDTLATLIRGQKLPIFSGNGLPHNELAAQIARQAKISDKEDVPFAIVFAAIGVKHDDAAFFRKTFEESGTLSSVVMFQNLADDPIVERISTPRCALTAAEYLAFEEGYHVLVIMTDLTSYCEALREIASAREEVPSRKGYPGYLYSDLASLYERAGMIKNKVGSITFLPILTMPNDDITHPIPDLTGYITEGQIVLSRELANDGVYPPVNVLPSLSRLMKDGIGEGYTSADHPDVANQLFSLYSRVQDIRGLAQIIGENDLSEMDRKYMEFGRAFESDFVVQKYDENRSITESLKLSWRLMSMLPKSELTRLSEELINRHYVG
ncbi:MULTISPECIES: V-type ATP synthase subunit B [unclassified Fusibacter]|uniref:V-type ATP synthase subunit B n=1 Tax=unclassified Fusibacter TaxID=2624464 RepID=UPI001010AF20|nr:MULTISPECIES: V-type ATP synthase subunit B [unclassified Fusibacter]MCK8059886.1 V-type ATP synthase subunit B [Fusibacter sp. A2]NPE21688.1 V-type ATP synthase subunit B [Fusibacter sp. A1]RXV62091.1 V-type ATP synthase subunit B [Fusibacter sp. A1]